MRFFEFFSTLIRMVSAKEELLEYHCHAYVSCFFEIEIHSKQSISSPSTCQCDFFAA